MLNDARTDDRSSMRFATCASSATCVDGVAHRRFGHSHPGLEATMRRGYDATKGRPPTHAVEWTKDAAAGRGRR
jgi:hypothetical protein